MAEVIAADNAAKEVAAIGKKVLDDYRNNHTEEEIKNDTSIIGHLIRRYFHLIMLYFLLIYVNFCIVVHLLSLSMPY